MVILRVSQNEGERWLEGTKGVKRGQRGLETATSKVFEDGFRGSQRELEGAEGRCQRGRG